MSAGDIKRVTREIQILKHVRHTNVVRLLEVIEKPHHIYLVTEYLPGGELFEFIVAHNRLHESQACHIFRQVRVRPALQPRPRSVASPRPPALNRAPHPSPAPISSSPTPFRSSLEWTRATRWAWRTATSSRRTF